MAVMSADSSNLEQSKNKIDNGLNITDKKWALKL